MEAPPLIREFKRRANAALPGRVAEVVLFGSRARGDAMPDSDWDVAVFLTGQAGYEELSALADAAYDLIVETGQFIQPLALPVESGGESLLLRNIRRDGVPV